MKKARLFYDDFSSLNIKELQARLIKNGVVLHENK